MVTAHAAKITKRNGTLKRAILVLDLRNDYEQMNVERMDKEGSKKEHK